MSAKYIKEKTRDEKRDRKEGRDLCDVSREGKM